LCHPPVRSSPRTGVLICVEKAKAPPGGAGLSWVGVKRELGTGASIVGLGNLPKGSKETPDFGNSGVALTADRCSSPAMATRGAEIPTHPSQSREAASWPPADETQRSGCEAIFPARRKNPATRTAQN